MKPSEIKNTDVIGIIENSSELYRLKKYEPIPEDEEDIPVV